MVLVLSECHVGRVNGHVVTANPAVSFVRHVRHVVPVVVRRPVVMAGTGKRHIGSVRHGVAGHLDAMLGTVSNDVFGRTASLNDDELAGVAAQSGTIAIHVLRSVGGVTDVGVPFLPNVLGMVGNGRGVRVGVSRHVSRVRPARREVKSKRETRKNG